MKKNVLPLWIVLLSSGLLIQACEHEVVLDSGQQEATLSNIQQRIFSPGCGITGCHVPGGTGPMPLRTAQESFDNLVNVNSQQVSTFLRVKPGDPNDSYLIMKLKNDQRIRFARMPVGGNPLSPEDIQLIEDWISAGAERN